MSWLKEKSKEKIEVSKEKSSIFFADAIRFQWQAHLLAISVFQEHTTKKSVIYIDYINDSSVNSKLITKDSLYTTRGGFRSFGFCRWILKTLL